MREKSQTRTVFILKVTVSIFLIDNEGFQPGYMYISVDKTDGSYMVSQYIESTMVYENSYFYKRNHTRR